MDLTILEPGTREELSEMVRSASRDRKRVIPWGGPLAPASNRGAGAEAFPQNGAPAHDVAIDLSGLDRILEYQAEDLTLTAEAGVALSRLRGAVAERGQELPLEAPGGAARTLGGVLASDDSGPRRLRLGAPRDRILGARFVLADGTLVRTGGKVVKNVAGYGIHRLLCGSYGGLAILVEASLKLLPAPASRLALMYATEPSALADAARWRWVPRLEPAVLTVLSGELARRLAPNLAASSFLVIVGFEDEETRVRQLEAVTIERLGPAVASLRDGDALDLWSRLADLQEYTPSRLGFTTSANTPDALATLPSLPAALVFHAPAGRLHLFVDGEAPQAFVARLAEHGFTLTSARGVGAIEPSLPPQAGVRALRRRIREGLDPQGIWAMGASWEAEVVR